jgi:hypothetical protein
VFLEWFGTGRGVVWREKMMGIIFGRERWECWRWDSENKFGTEDNGRSWRAELGEIDFGGEVWRQLMVSSSRNFINFKKQERCRET